jgi:hypothetical protein
MYASPNLYGGKLMQRSDHFPNLSRISETVVGWAIQVHGIGPLLDWAIGSLPDAEALHPRLRAYLADQRRLSGERVALLLQDLTELLGACRDAGIPVLPLKGSLLTTQYYPEPGLRPMNDLDLLIRPADEPRMLDVMGQLRYQPVVRTLKHLMLARPECRGRVVSSEGEHPQNPRSVDLHIRLHEDFWGIRYDLTEHAWADSQPGSLMGAGAQILRPAALLHHLAVHATNDMIARRIRLLHLQDIALVAPHVDAAGWQRIVTSARAQREERYVYPPLALTNRYYPVVPERVLKDLKTGIPHGLLSYLDESSLEQVSFCNSAPSAVREKLGWFHPGRERVVAISRALLPKPGEISWWYPRLARPALLPLAYARYSAELVGWLVRWTLGMPRHKLFTSGEGPADRGSWYTTTSSAPDSLHSPSDSDHIWGQKFPISSFRSAQRLFEKLVCRSRSLVENGLLREKSPEVPPFQTISQGESEGTMGTGEELPPRRTRLW